MNADYRLCRRVLAAALIAGGLMSLASCSRSGGNEPWSAKNAQLISKLNLKTRERVVPATDVPIAMEAGKPQPADTLKKVIIASGVSANLAWSKGAMLEILDMQPNSSYPEQKLAEEVFTAIQEGSATCTVDGQALELQANSLLYLTPDMTRSLKAGPNGAKALEVFSPVRADLLQLAGMTLPAGGKVSFPDQGAQPSLRPGEVYRLTDIQLAGISAVAPDAATKRSGANSRVVWGKNVQLSFLRMDPRSSFPMHIHPEHQLMYTVRGSLDQTLMDVTITMTGAERSTLLMPGGMVHGAKLSDVGADALDIFWPVRPDYVEFAKKQQALFEQVIAPGTRPVKVADGFSFTEGPTWLKGKLYFSDMYFKDHTGNPARSRLIALEPDGKWKVVSQGAITNGTIATAGGHLIVCDMFGHRVIEMDPATGKVVRTVLDKINGKPIDGPNDLVMDAKGGIYITDPQFTAGTHRNQPGIQVYYVAPDGAAKVVIPAGEYARPNGVEISPDGKTLYVNNTTAQPGENFVYAYDIQPDGSLSNKRKFAELNLPESVLSATSPADRFNSGADGSAVDMDGRVYQATSMGVQIFDKTGAYVGAIWCPQFPVSVTFGGKNNDVLYMVGEKEVWSIQTKVKGFRLPAGLE